MNVYLLDFEASSLLPGSYPIEVAWTNYADFKQRGRDAITSYLIKPPQDWLEFGTWSEDSALVHNISMETLMHDGRDVEFVANQLAELCRNPDHKIYTDAPATDVNWAAVLLEWADERVQPGFRDFVNLAGQLAMDLKRDPMQAWAEAENYAEKAMPVTHRAADDVVHLATILQAIENPELIKTHVWRKP